MAKKAQTPVKNEKFPEIDKRTKAYRDLKKESISKIVGVPKLSKQVKDTKIKEHFQLLSEGLTRVYNQSIQQEPAKLSQQGYEEKGKICEPIYTHAEQIQHLQEQHNNMAATILELTQRLTKLETIVG